MLRLAFQSLRKMVNMEEELTEHTYRVSHLEEKNTWLKILVGALIVAILGAIFWAGAAYQRFSSMEVHLSSIDLQMSKIGDVESDMRSFREMRMEDQRRIDNLEKRLFQQETTVH